MTEEFCSLCVKQKLNHCGACSASYCFFVLGKSKEQVKIREDSGVGFFEILSPTDSGGIDEDQLIKAIKKSGFVPTVIHEASAKAGGNFLETLRDHLLNAGPAILSVDAFEHWVAVIGLDDNKFVIADPNENLNSRFKFLTDTEMLRYSLNKPDEKEKDRYYAIAIKRKDDRTPAWQIDKEFVNLCKRGSLDTAAGMLQSLRLISKNASQNDTPADINIADIINTNRDTILASLSQLDWKSTEHSLKKVASFLNDYIVVARAGNVTCSKKHDKTLVVAYMVALLTTAAWCGEL